MIISNFFLFRLKRIQLDQRPTLQTPSNSNFFLK
jgi:hypothetical protein